MSVIETPGRRAVAAHAYDRQDDDWYTENRWCSRRLFDEEKFNGPIHDPCCGSGRIVEAARAAGHEATGADLRDRGFGYDVRDFFLDPGPYTNVVSNHPFDLSEEFARHAVDVAQRKVAMIMPTRRLNAAWPWITALPFYRLWFLTPRPSMPPGPMAMQLEAQGKQPSGDTKDYCWLVFLKDFEGRAETRWLHRDPAEQPA
ncbi:MAG TPA: hypothetical protein VNQ99_17740 [Xanthobacteraceae bacterium]|nr:hypothetical protein [Xanthobacteraceae bacterium]